MKKVLMLLFLVVLSISLIGCGNKEKEPDVNIDYNKVNDLIDSIDYLYGSLDGIDYKDEFILSEITRIEKVYNEMIPEEKELITNYENYEAVKSDYEAYIKAQEEKDKLEANKKKAIKEAKEHLLKTLPNSCGKKDIDLPYDYVSSDGVKVYISWITSDNQTITNDGVVIMPRTKAKNVTLTATLKVDNLREKVTKTITVVPLKYNPLPKKPVFAYYMQGLSELTDIERDTINVLNLSFGGIGTDGSVSVGGLNTEVLLQERENDVRVLFSVQDREGFKTWTKTPEKRNTLANNFLKTVEKYHFDGVDIDWEYPVGEEIAQYTDFLRILQSRLKQANPEYLLTSAVYGGAGGSKYDIKHSQVYLDYVHLMTYDLNSSDLSTHLTALGGSNYGIFTVKGTVEHYRTSGVPKEKLVVGAAFYGKVYNLPVNSSGFYRVAPIGDPKTITYNNIKNTYLDKIGKDPTIKIEKVFEEGNQAHYLAITEYDNNGKVTAKKFITFDSAETVKAKAEYVFKENLGGMMFWELGSEHRDSNDLVKAINSVFKNKQ